MAQLLEARQLWERQTRSKLVHLASALRRFRNTVMAAAHRVRLMTSPQWLLVGLTLLILLFLAALLVQPSSVGRGGR